MVSRDWLMMYLDLTQEQVNWTVSCGRPQQNLNIDNDGTTAHALQSPTQVF